MFQVFQLTGTKNLKQTYLIIPIDLECSMA